MKDYLTDIVTHTHSLGNIQTVKITGEDTSTELEALSDDKSLVVRAKFHAAAPEFKGTFGMPNLNKLNIILNLPEYRENSKIDLLTETKDGEKVPSGLHFSNAAGDFHNEYRFMSKALVEQQLKTVRFKGANWNVTFEPTSAGIQRFKFQANANSDENTFIAKTENGDLKFYFGDSSTHAGNFVFHTNVSGKLSQAWSWPVVTFMNILNLAGDKTVQISDEGAVMVTVDSGLIKYEYILPAQTK